MAALAAIKIGTKEQVTSTVKTTAEVSKSSPSLPTKEKLLATPEVLAEYIPPQEGIITKKKFFPGVKKTVVFLPELHKPSTAVVKGAVPNEARDANYIHQEIFTIAADLIDKFGKLPIVGEVWGTANNGIDLRNNAIFNSRFPLLQQLMSVSESKKRIAAGKEIAGNTPIPAFIVLISAFNEELIPVGTVTDSENIQIAQMGKAMQANNYLFNTPKAVCEGKTSKKGMNPGEIYTEFQTGDKKDVMHCYCALHLAMEQDKSQLQKRSNQTALNELKIALDLPQDLVLLNTGELHNQRAIEELEATQSANYLVISPVTLSKWITVANKEKEHAVGFFDSTDHLCEKLIQTNQEAVQKTLREMFKKLAE